jgi:DNA-binding NarL/FixJ family response regulator
MARILIIDDSPSAIQKAKSLLVEEGHLIDTLDRLIHLPERLKIDPPDVILLDLSITVLPGISIAKMIRRFQQSPIPIILYSSRPAGELARATEELKASNYVHKDDPDSVLVDAIKLVLQSSEGQPLQGTAQ